MRFNLTGVCWKLFAVRHIHPAKLYTVTASIKKYIFVYTAFTVSYRAVAGTSFWVDVFSVSLSDDDFRCPQNKSGPLEQKSYYNVSFTPLQSPVSFVFELPARPVSGTLKPHRPHGHSHNVAVQNSSTSRVLPQSSELVASVTSSLSFPSNVHSTECRYKRPADTHERNKKELNTQV